MKTKLLAILIFISTLGFTQTQKVESIIYKKQYTIAQRDAMSLGVNDRKQIYVVDTGVNELQIWDGDSWETLGGGGSWNHVATSNILMNGFDIEGESGMKIFTDSQSASTRLTVYDSSISLGSGNDGFGFTDTGSYNFARMSANDQSILMTNEFSASRTEFTGDFWFDSGFRIYANNFTTYADFIEIKKPNGFLGSGITNLTLPVGTSATLPIAFTDGTTTIEASDNTGVVDLSSLSYGGVSTLTIKDSDRILLAGDSFMAGGSRDFKDKSIVSIISSLTDWTCEGYSNSGDTYLDLYNAINSNSARYGTTGVRDFNSTYVLTNYEENDLEYWGNLQARYWRDIILKTSTLIKSIGAKPILSTQFGNNATLLYNSMVFDAASTADSDFLDISSQGYLLSQDRYLPFWNNGHPGVRLNNLLWQPMVNKLNELERPNQSIKIFRNRPVYTNNNELLFSNNYERLKKWREISIGHRYTTDETIKYYDELDSGSLVSSVRDSEYLKLVRNENVTFDDKMLVQVILPCTSNQLESLKLVLSDKTLTGYVRKYVDNSYVIPDGDNIGFRLDIDPTTITVGDTYTSDQVEYSGLTFTVVSYDSGILVCSVDGAFSSGGLEDGTLTRTSGTGDTSLDYFGTTEQPSADFFTQAFEPYGEWELMTKNADDDFVLTDFYKYMDYDEIQFLIEDTGSFTLNDIYLEYASTGNKINYNKESSQPLKNPKQILGETNFDTDAISNWTNPDSKVPYVPEDSNTPLGTSDEVVELLAGESLSQDVVLKVNQNEPHKIKVRFYARYFPDIFDSTDTFSLNDDSGNNAIHENSFDFSKLRLSFSRTAGALDLVYDFDSYVYLGWTLIEKEIYVQAPKDYTTYTFKIECLDKSVELSHVSIFTEDYVEDVVLGDELFSNTTFDSDLSGWDIVDAPNVFWTSDYGGAVSFGSANSRRLVDEGMSITSGNTYRLTYEVKESVNVTTLQYFKGDAYVELPNKTVGVHSVDFVAQGTTIGIRMTNGDGIVIDNLSLKEIL